MCLFHFFPNFVSNNHRQLFLKSYLQIHLDINTSVISSVKRAKVISSSTCPFKTSVVIKVILNIILIVEMIAYNLTVLTDYKKFAYNYVPMPLLLIRKSISPIVKIPFSSVHGCMSSFTMIIFLKESLILNRDAISCLRFSSSGIAKAD